MKHLLPTLLLFVSIAGFSQTKRYLYYFDKDFNSIEKAKAVFYASGEYEEGLIKLMIYNNTDKQLVMVEHFTDSTLQTSEGLFQSYTDNNLAVEGKYVKGQEDGLWKKWDASGNLTDSVFYENGIKTISTEFTYFQNNHVERMIYNDIKNNKFSATVYDEKGKVIMNDTTGIHTTVDEDKVFTKTEIEAAFPGGAAAWTRYITREIEKSFDQLTDNDYGSCKVKFIVDKTGKISDVEAMTMSGTNLAEIAVKAIKNGPAWIPAQQNGRIVKAYRIQPVTISRAR